jgi:aspartokinase
MAVMFISFSVSTVSNRGKDDLISVKLTIIQAIRDAVDSDFSIQDALDRGYGNLTAIARVLKPAVEERLSREVKIESLVTSLKRLRSRYKIVAKDILNVIMNSTVTVRTDVAKVSVEKRRKTLEAVGSLLLGYREEFLQISESIDAITLLFDQRLYDDVIKLFRGDEVIESTANLAAIIVRSPIEIIKTPGCAASFITQLSRRHINIEDTISCYTDTIIVVSMVDASRAFAALTDYIASARRLKMGGSRERRVGKRA